MKFIDLTGQKFNRLTVVKRVGKKDSRWLCECSCGIRKIIRSNSLRMGKTKSCGCLACETSSRFIDLAGKKIGRLTVIQRVGSKGSRWLCKCSCGIEKEIDGHSLRRGHTKSCGCYNYDRKKTRVSKLGRKFGKLTPIKRAPDNKHGQARWWCLCDCGNKKIITSSNLQDGENGTKSCGCHQREVMKKRCGPKSSSWKGGRVTNGHGYLMVMDKNHPNAGKTGYVFEHVMVMSEYLGRSIQKNEKIHHINGIKIDNRIKNLELWTTRHPGGQRVSDMIKFCTEYLTAYAPERLTWDYRTTKAAGG